MDGLSNLEEINLGTSLEIFDTDGDAIHDGLEVQLSNLGLPLDPLNSEDGAADYDGDNMTNSNELNVGRDPMIAEEDDYGWFRTVSGVGSAMVIDSLGNQIVFLSGGDVDPTMNVQTYSNNVIVKYDNNANIIWAKEVFKSFSYLTMRIDDEDNLYVGLRNTPPNKSDKLVFTKYDVNGTLLWSREFSSESNYDTLLASIALDSSNNLIIFGNYGSRIDIDYDNFLPLPSGQNIFILKLDNNGNYITHWNQGTGSSGDTYSHEMILDSADNIYLAGKIDGSIDFDGTETNKLSNTATGSALFVARLIPDTDEFGAAIYRYDWAKLSSDLNHFPGSPYNSKFNLALGEIDNKLYVSGTFSDSVNFDLSNTSSELTVTKGNIFIAQYKLSGDFINVQSIGATSTSTVADIKIDASGNLYVLGTYRSNVGPVDFNPQLNEDIHTGYGKIDIYLTKFTASGIYQWSQLFGGTSDDSTKNLDFDDIGNLYLLGSFSENADLDGRIEYGKMSNSGGTFLKKFTPLALE